MDQVERDVDDCLLEALRIIFRWYRHHGGDRKPADREAAGEQEQAEQPEGDVAGEPPAS